MAKISKGQLEKLQKKYKTDGAIGRLYGITRQAVHQLRTRYGISPVVNKNGSRDVEIIKHYGNGVPGTKLAKRYNLSVSQTYRIINEKQMKVTVKKPAKKAVQKVVKKAAKKKR